MRVLTFHPLLVSQSPLGSLVSPRSSSLDPPALSRPQSIDTKLLPLRRGLPAFVLNRSLTFA